MPRPSRATARHLAKNRTNRHVLPPARAEVRASAQTRLAALFKTRTRAEWCQLLEGTDACFAPVLTTDEAAAHPHNRARSTYVEIDGIVQPAPAPRFSRTRPELPTPPQENATGEAAAAALAGWLDPAEIEAARTAGTLG